MPLYQWLLPLVVLGGAVVIAVAACDSGSLMSRALSNRWLVNPGRRSYGLYLWHPVLLFALGVSLPIPAVAASFVAAGLSYTYVEQPFLGRRRKTLAQPVETVPRPAPIGEARVLALEPEL
jgi:peptidoglycan/LPS O-acetylase OafA/YrhL